MQRPSGSRGLACAALFRSDWNFFFNDPATTETYTLSLPGALPIYWIERLFYFQSRLGRPTPRVAQTRFALSTDRKSTRLNSSHLGISYAVFCFKKNSFPSNPFTLPSFPPFLRRHPCARSQP